MPGLGRSTRDLGSLEFGIQGFQGFGFQGCRVLGFWRLGFQGCRVLGFQGFRVFRVLGFQGCRVLGLKGSGFEAF